LKPYKRGLENMIMKAIKMVDKGGLEKIAPKNVVTQEKEHPPQRIL
jgi:hypothetical protein